MLWFPAIFTSDCNTCSYEPSDGNIECEVAWHVIGALQPKHHNHEIFQVICE